MSANPQTNMLGTPLSKRISSVQYGDSPDAIIDSVMVERNKPRRPDPDVGNVWFALVVCATQPLKTNFTA